MKGWYGVFFMKKLKKIVNTTNDITFEQGYLDLINYCKINNYSKYTIQHYKGAYTSFLTVLDKDLKLKDINKKTVDKLILGYKERGIENITLNSYVSDFRRFVNFFIDNGYTTPFKITLPKTTQIRKDTYTDDELKKMLKKPNLNNKCTFNQYTSWVAINIILTTGLRATSLINIKIKDVDFTNNIINVTRTKNRKLLVVNITNTLAKVLKDYIKIREPKNNNDWLLCNGYGEQLQRDILFRHIKSFNKSRGVNSTGVHKLRHTFSKQYILAGGSVVMLSKILGHSNIATTDRYINLLTSDVAKESNEIDIVGKFTNNFKKINHKAVDSSK